jgi:hypothetical protein
MQFEICNQGQKLAVAYITDFLILPMNIHHWIEALPTCKIPFLTGKLCRQWKQVTFCRLLS